jgi:hypothetical protein
MLHGQASLNYAHSPEPRGNHQTYVTDLLGAAAARRLGSGVFEARVMASAEPLMGPDGYPLLLQTGESADGLVPLRDRQHPHDVLMELSVAYRRAIDRDVELFVYLAPVGAPAVGPTPFLHRASGRDFPAPPIGHHLEDGSHITYGVMTGGLISGRLKLEVSGFNSLEPDARRWNVEQPRLDSYAIRVSVAANDNLVLQTGVAGLAQPERLHPRIPYGLLSASVTYNRRWGTSNWQTTAVWGRRKRQRTVIPLREAIQTFSPAVLNHYLSLVDTTGIPVDSLLLLFPSRVQPALLLESTLTVGSSTVFARAERVVKDELFDPTDLRHSTLFGVGKLEIGLALDLRIARLGTVGAGMAVSVHLLPAELRTTYGSAPKALQVFTRLRLG